MRNRFNIDYMTLLFTLLLITAGAGYARYAGLTRDPGKLTAMVVLAGGLVGALYGVRFKRFVLDGLIPPRQSVEGDLLKSAGLGIGAIGATLLIGAALIGLEAALATVIVASALYLLWFVYPDL